MIRITSKVKIAAGIAAGALVLGGAGAYAANANNTVKTYSFTNSGTITNGGQTLNLVSTKSGQTLQFPTTPFKNEGQCTSWFAKNKTLALAPAAGTATVNRNFHGKLVSGAQKFCATYAKTDANGTVETETSDATETNATDPESNDSANEQDGASHGHGHGHGHSGA